MASGSTSRGTAPWARSGASRFVDAAVRRPAFYVGSARDLSPGAQRPPAAAARRRAAALRRLRIEWLVGAPFFSDATVRALPPRVTPVGGLSVSSSHSSQSWLPCHSAQSRFSLSSCSSSDSMAPSDGAPPAPSDSSPLASSSTSTWTPSLASTIFTSPVDAAFGSSTCASPSVERFGRKISSAPPCTVAVRSGDAASSSTKATSVRVQDRLRSSFDASLNSSVGRKTASSVTVTRGGS
mmetsp:Transcript_20199/g.49688  ORF Transcript_20199/g.49688 Transcript_20199/m.49688 type:complete len:239 (-) Transcript_20199:734-1450(-)